MAGFGELLSELRQDKGMTQRQLADQLYVTTATVSNYEHGVHMPDAEKLISIADLFGVTTDYLLGRTRTRLPIDVINETVLGDKSAGTLISEVKSLSPARKQALATLLDDMRIVTTIEASRQNNQ